ncbi:hypothetical protein KR018_011227, partial [Drosophila ironensis]
PFARRQRSTVAEHEYTRLYTILTIAKIATLVGLWIFFTVAILNIDTKPTSISTISLKPNETTVQVSDVATQLLYVTLRGSIEHSVMSEDACDVAVRVQRRSSDLKETYWSTDQWCLMVVDEETFNHASKLFNSQQKQEGSISVVSVQCFNVEPMGLVMELRDSPLLIRGGIALAFILFLALQVLIVFELIDRAFATILLASTAIGVLTFMNHRPELEVILSWVNFEPLMILFCLELIVAVMDQAGFFDFVVLQAYKMSKGQLWPLVFISGAVTAVLAALLDSAIIVHPLTPIYISLCQSIGIDKIKFLIIMLISANIGGGCTAVGNPSSALLATDREVQEVYDMDFFTFLAHMLPGTVPSLILFYALVYFVHRKTLTADADPEENRNIAGLKERIAELKEKDKKFLFDPADNYYENLASMEQSRRIKDKQLFIKCLIALAFCVLLYLLNSIPGVAEGATLCWIPLLAAFLLLITSPFVNFLVIMDRIQYSMLLFLAGLFVLAAALEEMGFFAYFGDALANIVEKWDPSYQVGATMLAVLWSCALLTILIDSSCVAIFMLRLCSHILESGHLDIPLTPMVWAIAFGSAIGGSGSLIGTSASGAVELIARKAGHRMYFTSYWLFAYPLMVPLLAVVSVYLILVHMVFSWH